MSRYFKLLTGALLVAAMFAPGSLLAAQATPAPKKEKKPKVYAKISAVDAAKNTVTITDTEGKDTEYTVDRGTTISLDGKSVKFADLTVGLRVDINISGGKLTRLEATTPPVEKADKTPAGGKAAGTGAKEKKAKVYAKISAVDAAKNTVTITDTDGKDTQYTVDRGTTISLDGKSVKFADITVGLRVDINLSAGRLTRLEAATPPEDKPDKKK